jgi:hypothetical protein
MTDRPRTGSARETPQQSTHLSLFPTDDLDELGKLLNHATMMELSDLTEDRWWQERVRVVLQGHPVADLDEQRTDLAADMRELLRVAATRPGLFETQWWNRRAHRALTQGDGIIGSGEDYIRQFRIKTDDGTWSEWQELTEESWRNRPRLAAQVRFAAARRPFSGWPPSAL